MRRVTRALRSSAARAQRPNWVRDGSPRAPTAYCTSRSRRRLAMRFFLRGVVLVGIDDALHQRVAHDVLGVEVGEGDAANFLQYVLRLDEPALLSAREVDLGDVAGHHCLAAEAEAGKEHLHLLRRGVLRLVEYHERMVEGAPAHEGKRGDLDRSAVEH